MRTFAAPEHDHDAHLVTVAQEAADVVHLRREIVLVDLDAELDGLHLLLPGPLARVLLLLLEFVAVLAVVHHLCDGRLRRLSYQNQVHVDLTCPTDSLSGINDPLLLAILGDQPDLPDPDLIIHLQVLRYGLHLQSTCVGLPRAANNSSTRSRPGARSTRQPIEPDNIPPAGRDIPPAALRTLIRRLR